MKTLPLLFVLVALCTVQGCSRTKTGQIAVETVKTPILAGDYYAPTQPDDPFKHRDWFVKVNGAEKGFVQYEVVEHDFVPLDHDMKSCDEAEFRANFPTKVDRRAVELGGKR